MKIFALKIFAPRKYKHVSSLKKTCPLCSTTLELDKRELKCPHGCDLSSFKDSLNDSLESDLTESEERKQHRDEYKKNPGKYKRIVKKGVEKVKKAFFIDKKV